MKKLISMVLALVCVLGLVGCGKNETYKIKITIPAGSTEAFVYSDEDYKGESGIYCSTGSDK